MRKGPLPKQSRFIRVKYTGVIELPEELNGISPTSTLTCASIVLEAGLNAVLPRGLKPVVRVLDARYEVGLDHDPMEKKRASRRRS